MTNCETCGRDLPLVRAEIEGVDLNVCAPCARFGKIKSSAQQRARLLHASIQQEAPAFRVVANITALLHQARQTKQMTQEDFAKLLRERESSVIKWENGSIQPDVETAQRVGRILGLSLVEKDEAGSDVMEKSRKQDEPTIGDMVKVRKRKG